MTNRRLKVRFTHSAHQQFLGALQHIRSDKPSAAVAFRQKVESKLRRLERFPDSGRHIPEFPDLPYREIVIRPYRFFYRVESDVVWIVALWHDAQMPLEP